MASRAQILAQAYRRAADALEQGTFVNDTCCGGPVDAVGRCMHRPGHATRTNPDSFEIVGGTYAVWDDEKNEVIE